MDAASLQDVQIIDSEEQPPLRVVELGQNVDQIFIQVDQLEKRLNEVEQFYSKSGKKQSNTSKASSVIRDRDKDKPVTGSGYPAEGYPSQEFSMAQGSAHGSYHNSVPNDDDDADDNSLPEEMSPAKPKKRATKAKKNTVEKESKNDSSNWTRKEEIALCKAWCDTSENSEMGNNKQAKGFWKKVIAYFEKEVGTNRTYNSIITKWKNRIRPRVGQFCAIYDNAFKNYGSGDNDLGIYTRALKEYQVVYDHAFTLEHCWEILKEHEVWKDIEMPAFLSPDASRKKARTSETGSDVLASVETRNKRPLGHDIAKKNKKKSSESYKSSYMEGLAYKWKTIKSLALGKKKEVADEYYSLKKQELEQKKIELEMEERKIQIEEQRFEFDRQKKRDKDILFYLSPIDPSLPALQRQKMQEIKDSIKERHNLDY